MKNTTEDGSPSPTEVLAETVALYGMYLTTNEEMGVIVDTSKAIQYPITLTESINNELVTSY